MAVNLWPNADLESGIDDWSITGSSLISQSSTQAWEQTYSLAIDTQGNLYAGAASDVQSIVNGSTQYTASVYVWAEDPNTNFTLTILDQDSNVITNSAGIDTEDTWTRITRSFTTGADDTGIILRVRQNNRAVDTNIYVDAFQLETGASASAWVNYVEPGVEVTQSPLGTLAVAGLDPVVTASTGVTSGLGTLTVTGARPSVSAGTSWEVGAYIYTTVGGVDVNAELGTLDITGNDPVVLAVTDVKPGLGTMTVTGNEPVVTASTGVTSGLGTLDITGNDPTVQVNAGLDPGLGTLTVAGHDPTVLAVTDVKPGLGTLTVTGNEPVVTTGVATLTYDFESDTLTQPASRWTFFNRSGGTDLRIVGGGGPAGGGDHAWERNVRSTTWVGYSCDDVTQAVGDAVVEMDIYPQSATNANSLRISLRSDHGVPGVNDNRYYAKFQHNALLLFKAVNGAHTQLGSDATIAMTYGNWYSVKFEVVGTTIRAKSWAYGAAEPGTWDISQTDSDISAGGFGIEDYYGFNIDNISITSSDITTDVAVTQDPLGTLEVTGYDPTVSLPTVVTPIGYGGFSGDVKVTSFNPVIGVESGLDVTPLGTIEVTGYDPAVIYPTIVDVSPHGRLEITGYSPSVEQPIKEHGTLVIDGFNPTVAASASAVHLYMKFKDASGNVWTREIDRVPPVVETDANRLASSTNEVVIMDATGGDLTYTLPSLTGRNGFVYEVKKSDATANTVTVVGTIDNDANFILVAQDECVTVKGGTSTWWITT